MTGFLAAAGENHLAALPKVAGKKSVSVTAAEEINEKMMLTYETIYEKSVKAIQVSKSVTLKATNYTYHFVMGYPVVSGGFFSKDAQDDGNKVAVLNEKAAFDLFGTLDAGGNHLYIDMKPYVVVGVISDGDSDTLNVFVPSSSIGETTAECIVVSLTGVSPEQAKNELKAAGLDDIRFDFLNLGLIKSVVQNKIILSAVVALMGFSLIIIKKMLKILLLSWNEIKRICQSEYLRRVLIDKSGVAFKVTAAALLLILIVILDFALLLYAFEMILSINALAGVFDGVVFSGFAAEISDISNLYLLSNIFFTAFAIVFAGFTFAMLNRED